MGGIENRFADCRTVQETKGSITVTIPRPIAEEWGLNQGDLIPFYAEAGDDTAQISCPSDKRD